jgi:nitrogen fixation/metabolism regulation signal transduction histidine kinase
MGYLQRTIQATLTIWLSLVAVIIVAFGLSESLRVAGADRDENVLITFLVALGLILLVLWLLPRSFLTLKEERQDGVKQTYIQHVLFALSVIWATLAAIIIVAIGLYAALHLAQVEGDKNLLITFIVSLGLILLSLRFLPRSWLTLKADQQGERGH